VAKHGLRPVLVTLSSILPRIRPASFLPSSFSVRRCAH
jgi:hypothetical protein